MKETKGVVAVKAKLATNRKKILLIDDEKHLLISLRDYLEFEQFDVAVAQSAEEGLEKLPSVNPDLIVLDISMPGMGGLGFLKRISDASGRTSHPVLVLTARSMMKEFFSTVNVDGFLAKPCDEVEFLRKISEILAARGLQAEKLATKSARKKVLLAEDDAATAERLRVAFTAAGYEVIPVASGPEIIERAPPTVPDVIVLKEILPRLNGTAVGSLVDVMPSISQIPLVLYDKTGSLPASRKGHNTGARCIKKVVRTADPDDLLEAIRAVVSG